MQIRQRPEKQLGGASVDRGNGRQDDARPCFARRPVALLRRLRMELGLRYFGFGLFCARCSRRPRHSPEGLALTWASLSSKVRMPLARPASEVMTITTCLPKT